MKIDCVLSGKSFRETAKEVRAYREELKRKVELLIDLTAQAGYDVIESILEAHVDTGETVGSLDIKYSHKSGHYKARIVVASDAILFLEFGSGLQGLNGAQNPAAVEMPFPVGAGTYPSTVPPQSADFANWEIPSPGWHYIGDDGNMHWSTGMVASMPMYRGGEEMARVVQEIARKVFAND